jgi:hypothetical protein
MRQKKIDGGSRLATGIALAVLVPTLACTRQPPAKPIDPSAIYPAETDPTLAKIREVIPEPSQPAPSLSINTELTRKALLATLHFGKPAGVTFLEPVCLDGVGCRADVLYESTEAFSSFERKKFEDPHSLAGSWFGGNGRSPLLRDRERGLVATWFFLDQNDHLEIARRELANKVQR